MDLNRNHVFILIAAILVAFGVGFPVGYFSRKVKKQDNSYYESLLKDNDKSFTKMVVDNINVENMKSHLRYLTSIPHMGGTPGDKLSADYVFNKWKEQKLDNVEMTDYDVYLSFPDDNKFNNIQLTSASGTQSFDIEEPTYDPNLNYTGIPKPFLAYAKAGSVSSNEVYYANYGTEEDFLELQKQGIDVTGKIVICRYGMIFRGNKVGFAEKFGAKGVILYDDPKRCAPAPVKNQAYPNGQYLPAKGIQRGTVYTKNGDPLTPHYPSTPSAFRQDTSSDKEIGMPSIPAQAIGYDLAEKIFKLMEKNRRVDDDWAGEMNVTYTYGGKLSDDSVLTLNVYNQRKIAKTYNVQAIILGSVEPDKYVIIGNHRDAWSFGALDPTSGTSVMLEISRALMEMKLKKGWTPKRSILFTSWGSEEYGLIGSVEWVEEFKKKLKANAVAYMNIDTLVEGNYSFRATASPSLSQLTFDVTRSLKISPTETVYDRWAKNEPSKSKTGQPYVSPYLGSGSDYMAFVQKVGIPALDIGFVRDKNDPNNRYLALSGYPTYHSSYETFRLISDYVDPEFFGYKMSGTIAAEFLRTLADSLILPIDVVTYSKEIQAEFGYFQRDYKVAMDALGISLEQFKQSVDELASVALNFQERLNKIDKTKYHLVRIYNEQLRKFEGAFLDASGMKRGGYEHMIYAPSFFNNYGSSTFPALKDAIYNYNTEKSEENKNAIKLNLSIIIYAIQSATSILKEPFDFSRAAN